MEVAVGLSEAEAIGQEVGCLVVVGAVTAESVTSLNEEDVGHPDHQAQAG